MKIKLIIFLFIGLISCNKEKTETKTAMNTLNNEAKKVQNYIKKDIVVAHRGSTYWTPEETEPAYRWARNIGADYLELDLQLTKDNKLVSFHDDDLRRTTNIETIFPKNAKNGINSFTLKELRSLDVGTWFNVKNPERAKELFKNLKILTLKDVIMIAEGNHLIKEMVNDKWTTNYLYQKDPKDNGNRPGIYLETKHPKSNIEKYLKEELTLLGWNINTKPKKIKTIKGKVEIANTNARLILQSFSPKSIQQLEQHLPNIPKCFLLWKPDMKGDIKETYKQAITFAINNNVHIIGSSIAGEPNNYKELTATWMTNLIHKSDLIIHPYTFDTNKQLIKYHKNVDGVFTNRADLALEFYNRNTIKAEVTLTNLGY